MAFSEVRSGAHSRERVHQGQETATVVNNTRELGGREDIGTAIELLSSITMNDRMVRVREPILF